jgi:hypothetical protein
MTRRPSWFPHKDLAKATHTSRMISSSSKYKSKYLTKRPDNGFRYKYTNRIFEILSLILALEVVPLGH